MIGGLALLGQSCDDVRARRVDQQLQFVQARLDRLLVVAGEADAHECDLLPDRPVDQGAGERFVVLPIGHVAALT